MLKHTKSKALSDLNVFGTLIHDLPISLYFGKPIGRVKIQEMSKIYRDTKHLTVDLLSTVFSFKTMNVLVARARFAGHLYSTEWSWIIKHDRTT